MMQATATPTNGAALHSVRGLEPGYELAPVFEEAALYHAATSPQFWARVGHALNADCLTSPIAKPLLTAVRGAVKDAGRHPGGAELVLQRLAAAVHEGKVTQGELVAVSDLLGRVKASGPPDADAVVRELVPVVQRRMQSAALDMAVAQWAKKGDLAGAMRLFERAEKLGAPANADGPLTRIGIADVFAPLPPINWLVQELDLCPGAPHLLAGYGFSGKSLAAQSLALAVASGKPAWGRFATRTGRVLHLDYEQGRRLTLGRYQRLAEGAGIDQAALGDRLGVVCLPTMYLDSPAAEEMLTRECDDHALVVVDSLRASCPAAEENSSDVRRALDMLGRVSDRTGVTAVVIHHARKPQKDAPGGARMAIRGSSAIYDACASVLVFDGVKGEPVRVSHEKARTSGIPADDFALRIADVHATPEDPWSGGLRIEVDAAGPAPRQSGDERLAEAADTVHAAILTHPGASKHRLRELCSGMRWTQLDAAVELLVEQGRVEQRTGPRRAIHHHPKGVQP
jgi:hypothetical protein